MGLPLLACAGFALDFIWPYLLRYPRDEIAVIDAVCVGHLNWQSLSRMWQPFVPLPSPYR